MSLAELMQKQEEEEKSFILLWEMGEYTGTCPNCNRERLCICANGLHRCEKCNWCPETKTYII